MKITKNEELLVDSEMVVSFSVDYAENELRVFYLDEETEEPMEFYADSYNWESDDTEPQIGRIDIHGCGDLLFNLVGNHWNTTIKSIEGDKDDGDIKELAEKED